MNQVVSTTTSDPEQARAVQSDEPSARAWDASSVVNGIAECNYTIAPQLSLEIEAAFSFISANGLDLDAVEQEDFRLPSLARDIARLRDVLDNGAGFVQIRGLPIAVESDESQADMLAWAIGNYFGRVLRQGIHIDRRLFTVTDTGGANKDPTRIGATAGRSPMHTDNGCLEPRAPCYIGLMCVNAASHGGASRLISARTVFNTINRERPDLLPCYFERFAFRSPQLHVWPAGSPLVHKPIFEVRHGELQVHYARVMIEPGMEMAGTPLQAAQREALDFLDTVLDRDDLVYQFELLRGDMLLVNNLVMLHGRDAFESIPGRSRNLKRIWLRRRHLGAGDDPAALDMDELTG